MITRRTFSLSVGAAALLGTPAVRAQSDRIVLGQSAPFSGNAAQLGLQFNRGARLFFDQANAQGGVGGKRIELVSLDDGYEPDRCAENTRKLLADDVTALFGYVGTPTCLAALPLATAAKTALFAPFTGAAALRQPFNRYAFHLRASYNDETAVMVRQLTAMGMKKIAVFYQDDAYGKSGLEATTAALAAQNLKPVAVATVERNSVNVANAVKTLVAAQPDAIVQVSAYKSCAAFIRTAKQSGYGGTFYNLSFVGTQALADELGKEGAGVVVSQVVPSPYNPARPIAREFVDAVKKAGGDHQANFSSMEGYLAAKVIADGLRKAGGKLTRESLVAGLETLNNQSYGGFAVSFSPNDRAGSSFVELSMLTGDGRVRT
jgi:branched-chain amino acid transport system substrate-binding protein